MRYAKRLFHLLKRKWQRKKSLPYSILPPVELYDSIKTLVINNWDEIRETGNVFLLSKTHIQKKSNKLLHYCLDTWDSIRDQEIQKFNTLNKPYFSKLAQVAETKINYAISQSNWDKFLYELYNDEFEEMKQVKSQDITETKFILQKHGINIDTKTDTVDDYFTAIGMAKKMGSNG